VAIHEEHARGARTAVLPAPSLRPAVRPRRTGAGGSDGLPPVDRGTYVTVLVAVLLMLAVVAVAVGWRAATDADDTRAATGFEGEIEGERAFRSVAFSRDGLLVYAATGTTIGAWNVTTLRRTGATFSGHTGTVTTLAVSPNGRILVSAADDGTVRLWDTTTRQQVGDPLAAEVITRPTGLAISPDGALLAVSGGGGTALWDLTTRRSVGFLESQSGAHAGVAFSPDGARLATGDSGGGTVSLWDVAARRSDGEALSGHQGGFPVLALAFDRTGTRLADGSGDNSAFVYDLRSREHTEFQGHDQPVTSVVLTADARTLITASLKEVLIWDVASVNQIGAPVKRDGSDDVSDIALGPDGDTLAIIRDHRIQLWSLNRTANNRARAPAVTGT
jgi:WD40 repeat protein